MKHLTSWLVSFGALVASILIVVYLIPGVRVENGVVGAATVGVVFSVVNTVLGTIIRLFTLPLRILTFGLFTFVINALMLYVTSTQVNDLQIDSPLDGLQAAVAISVISGVVAMVAKMVVKRTPLG